MRFKLGHAARNLPMLVEHICCRQEEKKKEYCYFRYNFPFLKEKIEEKKGNKFLFQI